MSQAKLPVINMVWIGDQLGPLERLSIVSFLSMGHPVHLHTYGPLKGVPEGTTLVDANKTVPYARVMEVTDNRPAMRALGSDYFRLSLQQHGTGIYMDADMVCLAPIVLDETKPLFGKRSPSELNIAVLYLPPGSPITRDILAAFAPNHIPYWLDANRKRQLWLKRLVGIKFGPADQRWGTFGPQALTRVVRRHGQFDLAAEEEVFSPYPYTRAAEILVPGSRIEAFIGPTTLAVHLWNNRLGDLKGKEIPRDSALGQLAARFGL